MALNQRRCRPAPVESTQSSRPFRLRGTHRDRRQLEHPPGKSVPNQATDRRQHRRRAVRRLLHGPGRQPVPRGGVAPALDPYFDDGVSTTRLLQARRPLRRSSRWLSPRWWLQRQLDRTADHRRGPDPVLPKGPLRQARPRSPRPGNSTARTRRSSTKRIRHRRHCRSWPERVVRDEHLHPEHAPPTAGGGLWTDFPTDSGLDTSEVIEAADWYTTLLQDYGPDGAPSGTWIGRPRDDAGRPPSSPTSNMFWGDLTSDESRCRRFSRDRESAQAGGR